MKDHADLVMLAVALLSPLLSFAGAWAAIKVHLMYLRAEVSRQGRSIRGAHWRLDELGAPPAPFDAR